MLGLVFKQAYRLAVILCWGIGDAFAALVGKKFGKHKIYKNKTLEGSLAMASSAFLTVLTVLLINNLFAWYLSLLTAFIAAIVVATIELFTPNGLDTVTCPLGAMVVIILLLTAFGGLSFGVTV